MIQAQEKPMGLFSSLGDAYACPLTSISVEGTIAGAACYMNISQEYANNEKEPIEAVYTFPISDKALVTGLEIRVGDRVIKGVVKEREEAFREYDDAIWQGHTAALVERHRASVFEVNLGNIQPGESIVVSLSTVEELTWRDNAVELRIPTVVGQRYIPGETANDRTGFGTAEPTDEVPDADHITPPLLTSQDSPFRV